jgi:hypothetical protein
VIEQEAASSVDAQLTPFRDPSLLRLAVTTARGHRADEVIASIDREIAELVERPPSAAEVEKAKALAETDFWSSLADVDGKAEALGHYETALGDFRRLDVLVQRLTAVTAADVARAVRAYLGPAHRTIVIAEPEAGDSGGDDDPDADGAQDGASQRTLASGNRWTGQGYFASRVTDPGVLHSVANDYFPVLVARDSGVAGLLQGVLLMLGLVVAAAATAGVRLRHASDEHRKRWLVASVVGALCVYQPLASLGVLPLTGISWPGMGIDSPSDLWLLVIGLAWAMMGADRDTGDKPKVDERVRTAPRLRRARKVVVTSLALAGIAAVIVVGRVGAATLGRAGTSTASQHIHDERVDTALHYATNLTCPKDATGTLDDVIPKTFGGTPSDPATARFDRELRTAWSAHRPELVTALADPAHCKGPQLHAADGTCTAVFSVGWPELRLDVSRTEAGYRASCAVTLPGDTLAQLRDHDQDPADPRRRRGDGRRRARPRRARRRQVDRPAAARRRRRVAADRWLCGRGAGDDRPRHDRRCRGWQGHAPRPGAAACRRGRRMAPGLARARCAARSHDARCRRLAHRAVPAAARVDRCTRGRRRSAARR